MPVSAKYLELRVTAPDTEHSHQFLQGMLDRMSVSYYKYGAVRDAFPDRVDALKSLEDRLRCYAKDGNTEWLMDVANFAMIEFMHPSVPDAHYRPTSSDESPGRRNSVGKVTTRSNEELS